MTAAADDGAKSVRAMREIKGCGKANPRPTEPGPSNAAVDLAWSYSKGVAGQHKPGHCCNGGTVQWQLEVFVDHPPICSSPHVGPSVHRSKLGVCVRLVLETSFRERLRPLTMTSERGVAKLLPRESAQCCEHCTGGMKNILLPGRQNTSNMVLLDPFPKHIFDFRSLCWGLVQ